VGLSDNFKMRGRYFKYCCKKKIFSCFTILV